MSALPSSPLVSSQDSRRSFCFGLFAAAGYVSLPWISCGCGGSSTTSSGNSTATGTPSVSIDQVSIGASQISGHAYNVDRSTTKIVAFALTNQFYVQPLITSPFTDIASDSSWKTTTNPWSTLVVLLVNPNTYTPPSTSITNPALDPGVIAYAIYPSTQVKVQLSGYDFGIKMTGSAQSDQYDPGPNFWSADPSIISVQPDGLHLRIAKLNGVWQCSEAFLLQSLGYGVYTSVIGSRVDTLDQNTVAAPQFIYSAVGQEIDNEYSGGALIPFPNNAQFVTQPYTIPGNLYRYTQPAVTPFSTQIEWRADHITFTSWKGNAATPAMTDIINQWTYKGSYIPVPGSERVRFNVWLFNGDAPVNGQGDELIVNSFSFHA